MGATCAKSGKFAKCKRGPSKSVYALCLSLPPQTNLWTRCQTILYRCRLSCIDIRRLSSIVESLWDDTLLVCLSLKNLRAIAGCRVGLKHASEGPHLSLWALHPLKLVLETRDGVRHVLREQRGSICTTLRARMHRVLYLTLLYKGYYFALLYFSQLYRGYHLTKGITLR